MHRERTFGRPIISARAESQRRIKDWASGSNRSVVGRTAGHLAARAIGGHNLESRMAQRQGAVGKEINDQIATGMDDEIRGLTVDKATALSGQEGVDWRINEGRRQFKTLGGAWVNEASVDEGHRRWGRDHFAQQAALSYEMRKANTEQDVDRISKRYSDLASGSWHMTDTEAKSAWTGAAFENQNQHIEFKKTNWETGELGSAGYQSLTDEIYEKKGAYPLAQMHSRSIERLKQAYDDADQIANGGIGSMTVVGEDGTLRAAEARDVEMAKDRQRKIAAISEMFMHDLGYSGMDKDGKPVMSSGGGSGERRVTSGGAAHLNERVFELARATGRLTDAPTGADYASPTIHTQVDEVNPDAGTIVLPNQDRQS